MSIAVAKPLLNVIRGRPLTCVFEVTLRCNSACGYCDLPLNQGRYELERTEIQRIFEDLYSDGLRFVLLQGGEPTVRKDLPGILEDLAAIGFHVTLVTNGTRLRGELIRIMSKYCVSVSVSLDTLDRERYRRIRGADQLPMVLAGIERLHEYPHPKFLTCIVSEVNKNDVMDVVRFAREKQFTPVIGAYHWGVDRYGKVDATLQYENVEAIRVFETILDSGELPVGYFREFVRENIRWLQGSRLEACDAGRYSIAIDASGNVAPCLAKPHAGNLRTQSLNEVLSAFDQTAIRACSNASSCNMMCSRVTSSLLRHPARAVLTWRDLR